MRCASVRPRAQPFFMKKAPIVFWPFLSGSAAFGFLAAAGLSGRRSSLAAGAKDSDEEEWLACGECATAAPQA